MNIKSSSVGHWPALDFEATINPEVLSWQPGSFTVTVTVSLKSYLSLCHDYKAFLATLMPSRDCHKQCPSALVCQYALPVFECHILCPSVPVCPACIWALGLVLWKALYRRPGQPRRFVQLKIFLALFCLTFFKFNTLHVYPIIGDSPPLLIWK